MSNNAYSVLMHQQFNAHTEFHKAWKEHSRTGVRGHEAKEVTEARESFSKTNDRLWDTLLDPLQVRFNADPESTVDDVIDFLEVDIPAFRCGYLKEYFLQHLKSVDLTKLQKDRICDIALQLCEQNTVRREFRRWVNLMSVVADELFVNQLKKMLTESKGREDRAVRLMLHGVLKNRKDLSENI